MCVQNLYWNKAILSLTVPLRGIPLSCVVGGVPLVVGGGGAGVVGKSLVRFVTKVFVGEVGEVMEDGVVCLVGNGVVCFVGDEAVCLVGNGLVCLVVDVAVCLEGDVSVSLFVGLLDVVGGSNLEETGVSLLKENDGVVVTLGEVDLVGVVTACEGCEE